MAASVTSNILGLSFAWTGIRATDGLLF
jgi:hypothetical protein